MTTQKLCQTRGRMLAFLLLLAVLVAVGVPQGQDAFAEGGGGNDTIISAPAMDSTQVVSPKKELTFLVEMSFGDWLLMMASMLL